MRRVRSGLGIDFQVDQRGDQFIAEVDLRPAELDAEWLRGTQELDFVELEELPHGFRATMTASGTGAEHSVFRRLRALTRSAMIASAHHLLGGLTPGVDAPFSHHLGGTERIDLSATAFRYTVTIPSPTASQFTVNWRPGAGFVVRFDLYPEKGKIAEVFRELVPDIPSWVSASNVRSLADSVELEVVVLPSESVLEARAIAHRIADATNLLSNSPRPRIANRANDAVMRQVERTFSVGARCHVERVRNDEVRAAPRVETFKVTADMRAIVADQCVMISLKAPVQGRWSARFRSVGDKLRARFRNIFDDKIGHERFDEVFLVEAVADQTRDRLLELAPLFVELAQTEGEGHIEVSLGTDLTLELRVETHAVEQATKRAVLLWERLLHVGAEQC